MSTLKKERERRYVQAHSMYLCLHSFSAKWDILKDWRALKKKKKTNQDCGESPPVYLTCWLIYIHIASYSFGEGDGNPLQYSCLENPMDGGAWWAAVYGISKSRTRLNNFTFTFHFHALKKKMATHSSVLTWRIPGTGEPGGLPSMGSHRVGHDWSDLAAAAAAAIP